MIVAFPGYLHIYFCDKIRKISILWVQKKVACLQKKMPYLDSSQI